MDVKKQIEPLLLKLEEELFNKNQMIEIEYEYKNNDDWSKNESLVLQQLQNIKGNVYCIFIQESNKEIQPVYVGKSNSVSINKRLREHLFKKSDSTKSKLEKVQGIIMSGGKIFINIISIKPEYMKNALEMMIINNHKKNLVWNQRKN